MAVYCKLGADHVCKFCAVSILDIVLIKILASLNLDFLCISHLPDFSMEMVNLVNKMVFDNNKHVLKQASR